MFIRHGMANDKVNDYHTGTEIGFSMKGFGEDDTFNFGFARITFSHDYRDATEVDPEGHETDANETVLELNYHWSLCENFTLIPDYQYLMNPGGNSTLDDAQVAALRFEINF